jgi:hypothetical protein
MTIGLTTADEPTKVGPPVKATEGLPGRPEVPIFDPAKIAQGKVTPAGRIQRTSAVMMLAWQDIQSLSPAEAYNTAYIWIDDPTPLQRWKTWSATAGHLNFLSRGTRPVSPLLILADGTVKHWLQMQVAEKSNDWAMLSLMRINLFDIHQTREQWDKLSDPRLEMYFRVFQLGKPYPAGKDSTGKSYPAGNYRNPAMAPWLLHPLGESPQRLVEMGTDNPYVLAAAGLVKAMGGSAQLPIIEARNFVWQTAIDFDRPAGYYSWLGIKDQKTFEKVVRADFSQTRQREAVSVSGISQQARVFDRYGRGDGTWITYDQVNQRGIGRRNPLTTFDPRTYQFDASRAFGRMDNGFWAYALFDKDGNIQQSAPDGVGFHRQTATNDGKIHAGDLVCLHCHDDVRGNGGIKPFKPYFRNLWASPGPNVLSSFSPEEVTYFSDLYLTDINVSAEIDKQQYALALQQVCGIEPHVYAANLYETFHSWDQPLDIKQAAWEVGVTEDELRLSLQFNLFLYGTIDEVNANWVSPAARRQKIGRDQWTEAYNKAQLAIRGFPTWPDEYKTQTANPVKKEVGK